MKDESYFKELDEALQVVNIGLYSRVKELDYIYLTNIDIKKESHLCILHAARNFAQIYNLDFYLDLSFLDARRLKKQENIVCKRKKQPISVDCAQYVSLVEGALEKGSILSKIYENYFKLH